MVDLRKVVDDLIEADKVLVGAPEWNQGPRAIADGQVRWCSPLSIDGEICPVQLIVDAYPRRRNEVFTITVAVDIAVTRVDYDQNVHHMNGGSKRPSRIPHGLVQGPHCHFWADNRRLATAKKLPLNLKYATPLPIQTRGFANTFRWLCGEINVACGADVPDLPPSDLLL